eukprot:CAMPEP_0179234318 /NCGR_PEP_ID=MMETSP0797-20121207/12827_1 /TAXON_ID=47934 /ORGANISM="Dinophysis acuminata, Strain DAEP01" /LENGTH=191 /DNA_ID=CAMNT_0020941493 /DNA_START=77 /DNA_END=648 /DNA_ORIENTATION=+
MVWIPDEEWYAKGGGKGDKGDKGGSGGSGGKGASKGSGLFKGGSSIGWMPAVWHPQFQKKGGWDGGKGGGKGWRQKAKAEPAKTVWVGNIPEGLTSQELKAHAAQVGSPKWAEVFTGKSSGTGAVGYGTAEETEVAIATLNGTELNGVAILCDVWEQKAKAMRARADTPGAPPASGALSEKPAVQHSRSNA